MGWMDAINEICARYAGSAAGAASAPADPHQDYRNIAQAAPPEVLADALSHTFRSDQTPSFPDMVSNLFRESNSGQRSGLLRELIQAISPAALQQNPELKDLAGTSSGEVSVEQVKQAAAQAQQENPTIIDRVSKYYAQHPDVVKGLGAAAITIAIQSIARRK